MKTCNDCKHSNSCIMSAPDGKWSACESFKEKEMKDLISRGEAMAFPNTWKEFEEKYGFTDKDETYTNGARLIPSFRAEQWLEHIARPKGKWIRITQGADPEKYMCPFCHRTVYDYGPDCMVSIRYPYCHCGADMREEE